MENACIFVGLPTSGLSALVCMFRPQESELLRLKAFILFGKLAKMVGISKRHLFKGEVKKAWIPLLLHCQDPCSSTAQVRSTFALCPKAWSCCPQKEQVLLGEGFSPSLSLPWEHCGHHLPCPILHEMWR